jgi:phage gpG-like protein
MAKFEFIWPIGERRAIHQVITVHSLGLKDLREVWDRFIPNIRRRHSVTFRQMTSPFGEGWAPLSTAYAKWKAKHFPGKRILERTGELRRAASTKGAPGQFIEMRPMGFTFTVMRFNGFFNVGRIHQQGGKHMPRRTWLGLMPDDAIALQAQIKAYFNRLKGKAVAIGRGRA